MLYEHTHLSIYRFVYSLHGAPKEDVEDLTAQTYMNAWRKRSSFHGDEDAAMGWLVTIARNLVIDSMRKTKNVAQSVTLDTLLSQTSTTSVEKTILLDEQNEQLLKILHTLTLQEREMIILRYVLGWQVRQIANHLGIRENTASVRIKRILQKLQTQLTDAEERRHDE